MATTKLDVYNGALRNMKERPLSSLTETRPSRMALDADYDKAVGWCLEQGEWKHATQVATLSAVSAVAPVGYAFAFDLPADFARLELLSLEPSFARPLNDYDLRQGVIFANSSPVYLKYISSDATIAAAPARWSRTFADMVEWVLADRNAGSITNDTTLWDRAAKKAKIAVMRAKDLDAMNGAVRRLPQSSWILSRSGGTSFVNRER